ncbi:unnamed protein product [Paramecium sonneborni]|uniref:Uncharacterized protein n=1 Tax=Paramecium sonneborni TaxID=65129 RepID=A0A8S1N5S5_9CILI|nr:unnamed protein product [Paramecium sonneborni]
MLSESNYQLQLKSMLNLQNVFMIKPINKNGHDLKILIDYNLQYSHQILNKYIFKTLPCMLNTIPIFNKDNDPTQHGFILQIDQQSTQSIYPIVAIIEINMKRNLQKQKLKKKQESSILLVYPNQGNQHFLQCLQGIYRRLSSTY